MWPGVSSKNGWVCAKDIVLNVENNAKDSKSILADFQRKLKLSSAISPKALLKADDFTLMDKFRIVGDACFRP